MKTHAALAASLLLFATPALAELPSLDRVAHDARKRCQMTQQHIPAGKTVTAATRNCNEVGKQALASEQARRTGDAGAVSAVAE